MTLTTLLLVMAVQSVQDKAVYKDNHLGLQFEHPKSWKVRRDRYSAVFEFTVDGGQTATVQLFSAKYKDTADTYQLIQAEINKSMKRTIDRQWQEEFLGVPMLLTKISYVEGGKPMSTLTGLLYTSYEEKMNFRLTVPAEGAEKAEAAWHDVLLTLRTISGELPDPENPDKPAVKPEPPKSSTVLTPKTVNNKTVRGSVETEFSAGDTKFKLYLPEGWTISGTTLKAPGITGTLELNVAVGLPEEAGKQLVQAAAGTLSEFQSVSIREDPKPLAAKSGAVVGEVVRIGTSKDHPLVIGHIVGSCEAVYWIVTYRNADVGSYKKDKKELTNLMQLFFAEKE